MIKSFIRVTILVLYLIACSPQKAQLMPENNAGLVTNKQKVSALLKAIQTGATEPLIFINPNKYIQHNLRVINGIEGFKALIKQHLSNPATVNIIRIFQDGPFVFAHTEYEHFGPKIGFDIFRFEKGKIVEHWDNLQQTEGPSPSGHTMVDGPTQATNLEKTKTNKKIARSFVEDILLNRRMESMAGYFHKGEYIQHNPKLADNVSDFIKSLYQKTEHEYTIKYETIHKVLGEGNFVLTVSEGSIAGQHTSFYDLFRIERRKIAEHWNVVEPIAQKGEWKNDNGKFGF